MDQDRFEYECEQEQWWTEQDKDQRFIDECNNLIDEALRDERTKNDRCISAR